MPSRKQRRRRAKERRHEWEEVWVDEEGNEVEPPPEGGDATRRNGKRTATASPVQRQTAGRTVQPPSWRRVGKRGLIFVPLMFLTVTLLSGELSIAQRLINTAFLLAFFLPFSYAMDALMYRMFTRRSGSATGRKG
jgi:hypothetical protein